MITLFFSYIAIGVAIYLYCRLFNVNPVNHIPGKQELISIFRQLFVVFLPVILLAPLFWYFIGDSISKSIEIQESYDANKTKVAEEIVCYDLTDPYVQNQIK